MTKAELLAQLSAKYSIVRTPEEIGVAVDEVKQYRVSFFETGKTVEEQPSATWNSVFFHVYREGEAEEAAYYLKDQESNEALHSLVNTGTLLDINRIYLNHEMRKRIRGAIIAAASAIRWEDGGTANHSQRVKWAIAATNDPEQYIGTFACLSALDAAIQAAGGEATDVQINGIVTGHIDWVATTLFTA